VERQDEPLARRRREALVVLDEVVGLLLHVPDVEHVVQVAVVVGDQVEHHVAVVLVRVDVVKDHQGVAVETGGHGLSGLSVDDVKQRLEGKANSPVILFVCGMHLGQVCLWRPPHL